MLQALFRNLPSVVKNLFIINILVFIVQAIVESKSPDTLQAFYTTFALFGIDSPFFNPIQIISHMFMHGGFTHIFFNMFALIMFGAILERKWGSKRFLIFYFSCGLGAALLHLLVLHLQVLSATDMQEIVQLLRQSAIGASGAMYGLLIAFGMYFPNAEMMFLFLPFPIKAKYLMPILIGVELLLGIGNFSWDNIAHFAHLGGALIGFVLVRYWKKRSKLVFYN